MKSPKLPHATTKVVRSAYRADPIPRRHTRGFAASLQAFTYDDNASLQKVEQAGKREKLSEDESSLSSLGSETVFDIEDAPILTSSLKKRKRGFDSPSTTVASRSTATNPWTSPRKAGMKEDLSAVGMARKAKRQPAKRILNQAGEEEVVPPANWEEIYDAVREMRKEKLAPVDTMGCETLADEHLTPRDKRFQTLIALMLSSQTKDTTNAIAMRRLQTELPPPGLTLENILEVDPVKLNEMIFVVGFHNNKTRFIKTAALILRDEYSGDIPDTIEGLMRLPGVGPKMGYLCLSAAWGKTEGIGVDVHVHRITNLWGFHKTKNPEETRANLEAWLPRDRWHEINHLLVGFGQTVCLPVGRKCVDCTLSEKGLCPSAVVEKKTKVANSVKKEVKRETQELKEEVDVIVKEEDVLAEQFK